MGEILSASDEETERPKVVRVTRFNRSYKCAVEQIWYTLVIMDGKMDWGFYFS